MIRNLTLQISQLINQSYSTLGQEEQNQTRVTHSEKPKQKGKPKPNLKKNKMCDHTEPTPCPICFEDLGDKNIAVMDCGHKFHFKCMVKWNSTDNGDTCPLCRTDLGLPDMVDSSDEEEEGVLMISDFENDLEEDDFNPNLNPNLEELVQRDEEDEDEDNSGSDSDSDDNDDENTDMDLRETRYEIGQLLDTLGGNFGIKMSCQCCDQALLQCNFCSEPFCACKNTADKPQFKANPFNKLYNSHFDASRRDDDMIQVLGIENPVDEDLRAPSVCSRCFANRDTIIKATLDGYISENGGEHYEALLESTEVKAIFFNLYHDTSGQDNSGLYRKYPTYGSIEAFRRYISEKFDIEITENTSQPDAAAELDAEPHREEGPIAVSTPEPYQEPTSPPSLPSRRARFLSRVPLRNIISDERRDTYANVTQRHTLNTSFTQYDNDDIFVNVSSILSMQERYRAAIEEDADTPPEPMSPTPILTRPSLASVIFRPPTPPRPSTENF